ncbi:MAG: hypothetical protein ACUVSX_14620, partial [Aggregatilineales bacterium]
MRTLQTPTKADLAPNSLAVWRGSGEPRVRAGEARVLWLILALALLLRLGYALPLDRAAPYT